MNNHQEDTRRIAKNTLLLYARMFLMMLIGLYTSRVVLNTLGVDDYGIYNVVGAVVSMFSIFTATLSSAIGRFITYELGTGNQEKLQVVFSTSVFVLLVMAIVIVVLCESLGFWFLTEKMVIPIERMEAAKWVFHCSIIGFGLGLAFVPFSSLIIAHERMDAFAYMSLLDAVMKLAIVFMLLLFDVDKLKLYATLMLLWGIINSLIYVVFCRLKFKESKIVFIFDKTIFKHISSFAGWNLFGHGAWMLETQGTNLLINLFFGVQLNAARGIAVRVNNLVQQFVGSFMSALSPQITKSYAAGDLEYMRSIVLRGAKFSYLLMFFIALPVALETDIILRLWLKIYPDYTVSFVRFTLATTLCMLLVNPVLTALQATGNIRNYQITIGFVGLLQFPLIYIAFKLGFSPIASYIICLVFYAFFVFFKPWLVRKSIQLPLSLYVKSVLLPIVWVSLFSIIIPLCVRLIMPESYFRLIIVAASCLLFPSMMIWKMGLTTGEKNMIKSVVVNKLSRLRKGK